MKREFWLAALAGLNILILSAYAYIERAHIAVLSPAGPVALEERGVIMATLALCAVIVVPVFFILFFFAWRYRASGPAAQAQHKPNWDHDNPLAEFFWWLVPSVIILALAGIMWRSTHELDPYRPLLSAAPPLEVDVVALNWKWLFIYPSLGIATVNMLEVPQNTPVRFVLTADAPMNTFWIPRLGGQIMVMPGMTTQLNLMASQLGSYQGLSGNISGEGFSGMNFTLTSVSQNDFSAWVTSIQSASSTPLTQSAYAALAAPSSENPSAAYAPIADGIYTAIVQKYMTP